MVGLVFGPQRNGLPPEPTSLPHNILLPVKVSKVYHKKYLRPDFRAEQVDPEMARLLGEELLRRGLVIIHNDGPENPADKAEGYVTLTIQATIINPLSNLFTADLSAHSNPTP